MSKAVPPKFHTLEAHLVPFLREYNAGWPYSEEGIESSHHWIKFFREKTSHVTGFKRKYGSFISSWQLNKSEDGIAELDNVLQKGRLKTFAHRKRNKRSLELQLVEF